MAITEKDFREAQARGEGRRSDAYAAEASYNHSRARLEILLSTGVEIAFPVNSLQGLSRASEADLGDIEISPSGLGLHWPRIDVDLNVPSLLHGVFGTRAWMAALGATGGRAISEAKAEAARRNGQRGGRPRLELVVDGGARPSAVGGVLRAAASLVAVRRKAKPAKAATKRKVAQKKVALKKAAAVKKAVRVHAAKRPVVKGVQKRTSQTKVAK